MPGHHDIDGTNYMEALQRFLSDGAWQGLGAVLGAILAAAGIWVALRQRSVKALSFKVVSSTAISGVHPALDGELVLMHRGRQLKQAGMVVVLVGNTGDVPITADDFDRPVELVFPSGSHIASADVQEQRPADLGMECERVDESRLRLKPVLLNAGDSVLVKVVLSGYQMGLSVEGRVVGVSRILPLADKRLMRWKPTALGLALAVAAAVVSQGALPSFDSLGNAIGYVAAFLTTTSFLPQAYLTIRTRNTAGISLAMYGMFAMGVALWLVYGLLTMSWPIIVANAITLGLATTILGMKLRRG